MPSSILRIDSSRRDASIYPSSSEYRVTLETTLWNIESLDVIDAFIPMTEHAIPEGKNVLTYTLGTPTVLKAIIEPGSYTPTELASALTIQTPGITWKYHATSGRVECDASSEMRVYITSGLPAMLGIPPGDSIYTVKTFPHTFPNMADTSGFTRYLVIRSDDAKDVGPPHSLHPGLGMVFPPYQVGQNGQITSPLSRTFVPHPVPVAINKHKMTSLSIRIERHNGELYDTRGTDHVILVRLNMK